MVNGISKIKKFYIHLKSKELISLLRPQSARTTPTPDSVAPFLSDLFPPGNGTPNRIPGDVTPMLLDEARVIIVTNFLICLSVYSVSCTHLKLTNFGSGIHVRQVRCLYRLCMQGFGNSLKLLFFSMNSLNLNLMGTNIKLCKENQVFNYI